MDIFGLLVLVVWVLGLVSVYANARPYDLAGRPLGDTSAMAWLALCLLLGCVGFPAFLFYLCRAPDLDRLKREHAAGIRAGFRQCPACKEYIKVQEAVCPACGAGAKSRVQAAPMREVRRFQRGRSV